MQRGVRFFQKLYNIFFELPIARPGRPYVIRTYKDSRGPGGGVGGPGGGFGGPGAG